MSEILEKRHQPRQKLDHALVEIPLTYPRGAKLVCEILDIHDRGLSFRMTGREGYLAPGTLIQGLKLSSPESKRPKNLNGIIKYARPFHNDGEFCYKMGVELIAPKNTSAEKLPAPFPLRPKRYASHTFFKNEPTATFRSIDQNQYTGKVIDFSKYGAGIELFEEQIVLKISDTLRDFQMIVEDEIIFSGEATIVRVEPNHHKTRLAVLFKESILDFTKAVSVKRKNELETEFKTFMIHLKKSEEILDSEFKSIVADIRHFLEELKLMLDREDRKIENEELGIETARLEILKNISKQACEYFHSKIKELEQISHFFSPTQHEFHKAYFRHHLHSLLLQSPFLHRAYKKPLGFAGDYRLMNFLYREELSGKNLFSMFLDSYSHSQAASRAVANRIPYLAEKIYEHIQAKKERDGKPATLTSIGSGPAKELQILMARDPILDRCTVTCIDFDPESLFYAQEKILDTKTLLKRELDIHFSQRNITQLLHTGNSPLKNQDLIYVIGLFDYLSDDLAKSIVHSLYAALNSLGLLIIGNMDPANDTRFYMEYATDWYLTHRTLDQMKMLSEGLSPCPQVTVEREATKTNNFILIQKN